MRYGKFIKSLTKKGGDNLLPIERQSQILVWLNSEETLSISEISKRLNVSEMTVYRDINPLLKERKISKTSGGICLAKPQVVTSSSCSYCFKESLSRHPMQIITYDSRIEQLCCPHCGLLRYKVIKDQVSQIICRDFLHDTTISAKMAYFLLDADFNVNCCQPQVLAFGSPKEAKQFQMGFGGNVLTFEEAIEEIQAKMTGKKGCGC